METELEKYAKILAEQNRLAAERRAADKMKYQNENQRRAANGITVTPNPPAHRSTWNDQPPEDM